MIFYIRKMEDHHGFWNTILICVERPINAEDYQVVEVDSIRALI